MNRRLASLVTALCVALYVAPAYAGLPASLKAPDGSTFSIATTNSAGSSTIVATGRGVDGHVHNLNVSSVITGSGSAATVVNSSTYSDDTGLYLFASTTMDSSSVVTTTEYANGHYQLYYHFDPSTLSSKGAMTVQAQVMTWSAATAAPMFAPNNIPTKPTPAPGPPPSPPKPIPAHWVPGPLYTLSVAANQPLSQVAIPFNVSTYLSKEMNAAQYFTPLMKLLSAWPSYATSTVSTQLDDFTLVQAGHLAAGVFRGSVTVIATIGGVLICSTATLACIAPLTVWAVTWATAYESTAFYDAALDKFNDNWNKSVAPVCGGDNQSQNIQANAIHAMDDTDQSCSPANVDIPPDEGDIDSNGYDTGDDPSDGGGDGGGGDCGGGWNGTADAVHMHTIKTIKKGQIVPKDICDDCCVS